MNQRGQEGEGGGWGYIELWTLVINTDSHLSTSYNKDTWALKLYIKQQFDEYLKKEFFCKIYIKSSALPQVKDSVRFLTKNFQSKGNITGKPMMRRRHYPARVSKPLIYLLFYGELKCLFDVYNINLIIICSYSHLCSNVAMAARVSLFIPSQEFVLPEMHPLDYVSAVIKHSSDVFCVHCTCEVRITKVLSITSSCTDPKEFIANKVFCSCNCLFVSRLSLGVWWRSISCKIWEVIFNLWLASSNFLF